MTEKEVIMEVIGFFIVSGEREEDEQQHFEKILNFSLVSQREDERQYELNNKIERLEVLKQKMIEFEKPSFHHIAKIDRFIKFCTDENIQTDVKHTRSKNEKKSKISKLSELICSEKSDLIVEGIRLQYRNIQGKRLKLLLMALQDLKLIPNDRAALKFHTFCKNEFVWDVGSYQAMNDYNYNNFIDATEYSEMKNYIENIVK